MSDTVIAFAVGASLMILAGLAEAFLGVKAERKGLEEIATPLTAEDATVGAAAAYGARARAPSGARHRGPASHALSS